MRADIESVYDWIREPDNAESFSYGELLEWVEKRPISLVLSAKHEIKSLASELETQASLITELVEALENAQKTLEMMIDDDAIESTTVATAYAKCRESELECRSILAKAKGSEK